MMRYKIQAKMLGRLGNQMFIYAFVRRLSVEHGMDMYMILGEGKNCLECFDVPETVNFIQNRQYSFKQKIGDFIYKLLTRGGKSITQITDIEEKYRNSFERLGIFYSQEACIEPTNLNKDIAVLGYFQSEKCFTTKSDIIKRDFTFKQSIVDRCKYLAEEMKLCESCCLHIRLGDYQNDPVFGVCSTDYYQKAVEMMIKKKKGIVFYVFSDNIEQAKFIFDNNKVEFRCISSEYNEYESMYLGSCCKNYIISNSTFSWWMQYLSVNNNDKVVIAPSKWYNDNRPCQIYQQNWELIDV